MFRLGDRVRIRNTYPLKSVRGWVATILAPTSGPVYYLDHKADDVPQPWKNKGIIAVGEAYLELAINGLDEVFRWLGHSG
jgi:hypothetical protein